MRIIETMKKIYNLIINITAFIIAIMCLGMLLVAFGIKAIYDCNDDMPLFIHIGFWDVIMLIAVCFMLCLFLKFQDKINRHLSVRYIIAIYIIIAVLFIIYVPLKPFSDMQQIYQGAIEIANGNFKYFDHNAYFMQYPNNMLITLVYGMLF